MALTNLGCMRVELHITDGQTKISNLMVITMEKLPFCSYYLTQLEFEEIS
jgi:hypothetical protein